jgi:chromosome segregation ATPase
VSVFDSLAQQASRLATDVQASLKRARLEGERRLLQRQHRAALEDLGERTYELVRSGEIDGGKLGPELSSVESKLMEIEAKVAEIEALRSESPEEAPGEAEDLSKTAFPMVQGTGEGPSDKPSAGPGWDAAERFFARKS